MSEECASNCPSHVGLECECPKKEVTSISGGRPNSQPAAGSFLRQAATIVEGVRQNTHGDKERSFDAAARLWDAYLSARKDGGRSLPIRAKDVAALMGLLKIVRSEHGNPQEPDHYVDCCGYFALFGELAMKA